MPELNKRRIFDKIKLINDKESLRTKNGDNLPFYLRIQKDAKRCQKIEEMQKSVFFGLIRKKEELMHLKEDQDELFIEFWIDYLAGKTTSINDFLFKDGKVETSDEK